jgi:rhamnose utilization protein RhaD (predicted bifunctional aldolase and dehydrogenase)
LAGKKLRILKTGLNMTTDLQELISISQFYGQDKRSVIAGGGNTSLKTHDRLWIKASGFALATITGEGFAIMDREKLKNISTRKYSEEPFQREREIKEDLVVANLTKDRRPSVETSLHDLIDFKFVVHLHPTLVNGLLCGNDAEKCVSILFGEDALYVPYRDPGYVLFKEIEAMLVTFRQSRGKDPHIILLQNHGIFVGAETTAEIKTIYKDIFSKIQSKVSRNMPAGELPVSDLGRKILPAVGSMLSLKEKKSVKIKNNELVEYFSGYESAFHKISKPFTPDIIVYCKSNYIYCETEGSAEEILADLEQKINSFRVDFGYDPRVIMIKGAGLIGVGKSTNDADTILDIYEDLMMISWLSEFFGGQHFMTPEQIRFIDTWEVENYRRQVSAKGGKNL